MKILAIDTSCDETAAAVTENTKVLSNVVWSQASAHAKFGGVMPSLAQRMHEERIDWVIKKALNTGHCSLDTVDCIAVTIGPGLSIALKIGVNKAKELAIEYKKPLIAVNHVEAHLLSPFANNEYLVSSIKYPVYGLCVSGGNTIFVKINKIGSYEILAQTVDDALGEALDKAARMLWLGYPGGAILEKFTKFGNSKAYSLPIPIVGQEKRKIFTYSGLKSAFYRLVEKEKPLTKEKIYNLAASFQNVAFEHLIRVLRFIFTDHRPLNTDHLLVGGGVTANIELRKKLRDLCKEYDIKLHIPYSKKLCGDNAAMIGVTAFLNPKYVSPTEIDRNPNLKIGSYNEFIS